MKIFATIAALALMSCATQAAPKKVAPVKCPQCMMKMSTKKTAATPVAIKMNGKTYYCCGGCKPMAYGTGKATKKSVRSTAIPDCPKCNMAMQAAPSLLKKTPISVGGKTYYCCTICPKH